MATGYTDGVQSGKVTEFSDYAMRCARAFGALVTMRDDSMDAPIPTELPVSDWSLTRLAAARAELAEVEAMSVEAAAERAVAEHAKSVEYRRESVQRADRDRERYEAMLAKVREWTPPSSDHVEMKSFMEQQLTLSIDWDCDRSIVEEQVCLSGEDWRSQRIESLKRDIEYYVRHHAEEVERTENRNRWVRLLRESLGEKQVVVAE
jgi:hypothetical protein